MKTRIRFFNLLLLWTASAAIQAAVTLPADSVVPAASVSERGFTVRVVQGPELPPLANNAVRAQRQLNGTLTDETGALVPNQATPGPNAGLYFSDTVNFERDAAPFDIVDVSNTPLWSVVPEGFPGIPGEGGHADNFAVEVLGYLELPAGGTTFGISVGTDRTDVNNDDSFQVFAGENPRDFFAPKVAEFQRSAPPFAGSTHSETQFTLNAPVAGIYPIRILYWQTSLGANLTFYTVDTNTLERILVNDPNVTTAIKSYRSSTHPDPNAPYVAEVSPLPGSEGNSPAAAIEALLADSATTVATADVKLFLNNVQVTPQTLSKANGKITVKFSPNVSRPDPNNQVRLEFRDSAGVSRTNSWAFGITPSGGSTTTVTGQWDFDQGDLRATVGQPLEYFGTTATGTQFGTTAALGVTNINGQEATIMRVPGDVNNQIGYIMRHGIAPNGGGTRVNQYTLIMDVMVAATGPGAASLLQISSTNNTDDGDLFWQGNNFGQGTGGYNGTGAFTPTNWHRVVAAYDMAANPPVVTKYVDGIKQDDWTANQGLDNPRRALLPTAILFADGDQDERREMWVNSIQIRAGKMSDAEIVLLGGPTAGGIPATVPRTTVTGQWDFERGDLSPTIGKPLQYFDGVDGQTQTGTQFGTATELGIDPMADGDPRVMRVPGDVIREIGYVMEHGIAPNGGGTRVNQYTLIMDVMVAATGPGAASLLQTSSTNNTDDGDLFWQGNNFGQGTGGYNGTGAFTPTNWHRVVAAYDMAANPPVVTKFVDGIKQDDWTANQGLDNPRRALLPTAILFADGDQDERREMWVSSIQIRSGKLSDAEIVLLGGPSVSGIPVAVPQSNVTGQWDFDRGDLSATIGKPLLYFDGADGLTQTGTQFGTTTELGVTNVADGEARIMRVPGDVVREIGYIMEHGIAPNGGGTRVNQYTLIMDILMAETGPGAASLLQISSTNNTDDGDLFWQGNNFGQGTGGYNGTGAFTAGAWHRVAAAYDMAANPPVVTKFVDGIKQDDWTANQSLDNPRRALLPTAILFADGDQDERRELWVNSIQIRTGKLSDAELEALGGPTPGGIPILLSVAPEPEPPLLTIAREAQQVRISWPAGITGFTLQSKTTLDAGQWTDVPNVTGNSVLVPTTGTSQFFRLIRN
jgi:hypothetical protein